MLLGYIDRFGVDQVVGRRLGIGEMRRMAVIENISEWFRDRKNAKDMGEWATQHPNEAVLLTQAHRLAVQEGLLKD